MSKQYRMPFLIGRLYWRFFRDALDARGLEYKEGRGFLDRQFVVSGTSEQLDRLTRDLEAWMLETAPNHTSS